MADRALRGKPLHAQFPLHTHISLVPRTPILDQASISQLYLIRSSKDYDLSDRLIPRLRTKPFS